MTQTRLGLLALAFVAATTLGACSRAHLSKHYGQWYVSWFSQQQVNAKPSNAEGARRVVESLDAAQAAMVSRSYRKTRGAEDSSGAGSRMLMVGPQRGAGGLHSAAVRPGAVTGGDPSWAAAKVTELVDRIDAPIRATGWKAFSQAYWLGSGVKTSTSWLRSTGRRRGS